MAAKQALPAGKATIRYEFAYDGGGVGKGGTGTLFVNDKKVATGRTDRTQCCVFSAKVTIELKEMKAADAGLALQARKVAVMKKALSD